jgi:hypothetical protein
MSATRSCPSVPTPVALIDRRRSGLSDRRATTLSVFAGELLGARLNAQASV